MIFIAIIIALILMYIIWRPRPKQVTMEKSQRRVGSIYAYNDMFTLSHDELPDNTVTGPGGGSMVKNFVQM